MPLSDTRWKYFSIFDVLHMWDAIQLWSVKVYGEYDTTMCYEGILENDYKERAES